MVIAFTIMSLILGLLGILCTYIWKGNQKMEKALLAGLERLEEGQKKGFAILEQGQKEIAQMLLNQTRILERIEARIPMPAS